MKKDRYLFGFLPVWVDIKTGNTTGFWVSPIMFILKVNSYIGIEWLHNLFITKYKGETVFKFFPYKSNGCKNWFHAIYNVYFK